MALTANNRGAGSTNTGGQSTLVISPASNSAAWSLLLLACAYDNSGASGVDPFSSIVDSLGGNWQILDAATNTASVANDGVVLRTFMLVTPKIGLTTADTITVSFGGITTVARAWTLTEVVAAAGKYATNVAGSGAAASGSSTTPSVASVSVVNGDLCWGCMGAQGNAAITADSDTLNGSWSTQQTSGAGVTTAGIEIASQDKIVNATGIQTYNLAITSAKWEIFTRNFHETANPAYLTRTPGPLFIPAQRSSVY